MYFSGDIISASFLTECAYWAINQTRCQLITVISSREAGRVVQYTGIAVRVGIDSERHN